MNMQSNLRGCEIKSMIGCPKKKNIPRDNRSCICFLDNLKNYRILLAAMNQGEMCHSTIVSRNAC